MRFGITEWEENEKGPFANRWKEVEEEGVCKIKVGNSKVGNSKRKPRFRNNKKSFTFFCFLNFRQGVVPWPGQWERKHPLLPSFVITHVGFVEKFAEEGRVLRRHARASVRS